jgi:outer membrane protein insertion porin family
MKIRCTALLLCAAVSLLGLLTPLKAVAQSRARSDAQGKTPNVVAIEVQYAGPVSVSKDRLMAHMRTRVGQPFSEQVVEEDIRNLYATGNIVNVRIYGEAVDKGVKVIVVLQAKAVVSSLEIVGSKEFKASRLLDKVQTKVGDVASEAALEADRQKIIEYYRGKGFTDVSVTYKSVTNDQLGTARVTFEIREGVKSAIKVVRFEGNTQIKSSELQKVIKTKKYIPLWSAVMKTGRVAEDQLGDDMVAIREYYQGKGFSDVKIDKPSVTANGSKVEVVFRITEGSPYKVGKITFRGAQLFSDGEITKVTKLRSGAVYSPAAVQADIKALQDLYGGRGYVDFQAGARTSPGGDHVTDLNFLIEEGRQSYVGRVNISGNVRTKDKVIRRELALAPGDLFSTVRMDASKQILNNLNYFNKVELYPSETGAASERDLNVVLEEKRTGQLNFGAGFSSIDSILGFVELSQSNFDITNWPNFTGGGQKFRSRIQYGALRKDVVVSLTEPYFLDRKLSLSGDAFYRNASFLSNYYSETRAGFDLGMRKPLTNFSFMRFGYRVEKVSLGNVDPTAPIDATDLVDAGPLMKSQLTAGFTYDSRDSLFLSRKGQRLEFSSFLAGGPLGGDIQIGGASLEASKYFSLAWDTILTLNAEAGVVDAWGSGTAGANGKPLDVPLYDRLFLGGVNNLRGFRYRFVGGAGRVRTGDKSNNRNFGGEKAGSVVGEPIGGRSLGRFTIEYTAPVIDKVRAAMFYDAGFVNEDAFDFTTSGYNSDVGLGLRLELPIGPVRVDYAIPTKAPAGTSTSGRFNFNMGYQF